MEPSDSSPPPPPREQDPAPALTEDRHRERVSANDVMVEECDLEGLERKKEEMSRIFKHIHDTSSSVLEFAFRWEAIEEQFCFLKQQAIEKEASVNKQILELEKKEEELRLVEERQRKIQTSINERLSVLEEKEQVVVSQLNAKEKLLGELQSSMMKKHDKVMREFKASKDELSLLSKAIDDKLKDFDLKQTAETQEWKEEAELMETSVKQLEAKENELNLLNDILEDKSTELEKKEENLQLKQQAESRKIDVKSKFLELKEKKLQEWEKELDLRQRILEKRSIQAETFKRSRLESEPSLLAEKGRDAESLIHLGKKQKLITELYHNVEDKCVLHGKISSAAATEYEHTSEVERREADDIVCIGEVDEDHEPFDCPDPDFNNFNNTMSSFALGQVWALYDPIDDMPRYYARITRILTPQQSLSVKWLESAQTTENEDPIPACGRFKYGIRNSEKKSYLMFSHEMYHITGDKYFTINPREGETWALFRDWTKTWNSRMGQHKPPYRYDFVEVLSDFDNDEGIGVAYLGRVEGFTSVYKPAEQHGVVQMMISSDEMLRFSHRVPSFKLSGDEKVGVPAGSFELDPAAVPRSCLKDAKDSRRKDWAIVLV